MEFCFRSQAAVGQLISKEYGIDLQVRSIDKYLTHWIFHLKPLQRKRAYEQKPEAVQASA